MKPVIVVTVYRRYHELDDLLGRVRALAGEFGEAPDIVVVWARPEVGRLWYFKRLLADGRVTKLLTRLPLPGEADDRPTTYPESHNIRLGLEWVRANYDPATTYAVVLAADVQPQPKHLFGFIDDHMSRDDGRAVVFHWPNGCVPFGIWHTNAFAVCLDEAYWPPVLGPEHADTLEHAWGKQLRERRLHAVLESHNSRDRRFVHAHRSEGLPPYPVETQPAAATAPLLITGYQPWWRRWAEALRLVKPYQRPSD